MTKPKNKNLAATLMELSGVTKAEAEARIKSVVEAINAHIPTNQRTIVPGLGTFSKGIRRARVGRNPQTGETVQIAEREVIKFKEAKPKS